MEKATRRAESDVAGHGPAVTEIATPGTTSIEALQASLKEPPEAFLKTLLMRDAAGTVVAVVLPGDRDLNEPKLRKLLATPDVKFATDADFAGAGGVPGYIGPVGLRVRTLVDVSVDGRGYVAGANKKTRT